MSGPAELRMTDVKIWLSDAMSTWNVCPLETVYAGWILKGQNLLELLGFFQ